MSNASNKYFVAIIEEDDSEIDPNEEFSGIDEKRRRAPAKSFFEDKPLQRKTPLKTRNKAEYKTYDDFPQTECVDLSGISCLDKKTVESQENTNWSNSTVTEGICQMIESVKVEDVEISENEASQKPSSFLVSPFLPVLTQGEEDVIPTPKTRFMKPIHSSVVSENKQKEASIIAQKAIQKLLQEEEKSPQKVVKLLKDFKEGYLEKMSKSFLTRWKEKYCRAGNYQFLCYKNVSTGWISGSADFRRVNAKIDVDKSIKCFMYDI